MKVNSRTIVWIAIIILIAVVLYLYLMKRPEGFTSGTKVTLYYAPWCPHCKDMMPDWDSFAQKVKDAKLPIEVEKVSSEDKPEVIKQKGIQGFPSIRAEKDGKDKEYDGPRTKDALFKFAQSLV